MKLARYFAPACVLLAGILQSYAHPAVKRQELPSLQAFHSAQKQLYPRRPQAPLQRETLRGFTTHMLTHDLLLSLRDDAISAQSQKRSLSQENIHDIAENATPVPNQYQKNFTLDLCREKGHCEAPRDCIWTGTGSFGACEKHAEPDELCFCFSLLKPYCETSTDCASEEFCALPKIETEVELCVSRTYEAHPDFFKPVDAPPPDEDSKPPTTNVKGEPGGTQEPNESCIDARALRHLAQEDLVFSTHSNAHVLCDPSGSCATAGHVVVFNGRPMMMRSYCAKAGCEKRVMAVNSPRYRKALRVPSQTDGLEYTTFAARYETVAEEAVMKMVLALAGVCTRMKFGIVNDLFGKPFDSLSAPE